MIFNSAAVSTLRFYHQFPRYVHSVALCFYISLHKAAASRGRARAHAQTRSSSTISCNLTLNYIKQ